MSSAPEPPPPPCPPSHPQVAPCKPPPPPPMLCKGPLSPPSKISPAALRGLSNYTTVTRSPMTALQEAVDRSIKFNPSLSDKIFLCYNHHTQPRLQEGPQCGLVALAMAGGEEVSVDKVQEMAISKGYTRQGEMFSVDNMADLASSILGKAAVISPTAAMSDSWWVVEQLTAGWQLMVPYDCAHNHHPAVLGGRKAHWALITGFVLVVDAMEDITDVKTVTSDENKNVHIVTGEEEKENERLNTLIDNKAGKLLLVARQSKSLVLGLWDKEELVSSNNNLKIVEFKGEMSEFVIPPGGVEAGLCGRMVLVRRGSL